MKLGIDISQIVYTATGIARFTYGLTEAILNYDNKNQWLFFFSSLRKNLPEEIEEKIISKGHQLIKWKLPPTILSLLYNDLHSLSNFLTSNIKYLATLDFFITSDWSEPPLNINKATIVHDLVYLRYPTTVDQKILKTQQKRLSWVKKESKIIFADSQATKQDLVNLLHINPEKIFVNYPGVITKKPTNQKIKRTLRKFNLENPFILTVGKLEPRKNLKKLIEVFRFINNKKIDLVIVGPMGWGDIANIKHHTPNIKYLGCIDDEELHSLYSSCLFFIYPSIWEGFGYPIVEAMRLGAPVATSNTSSLKEIAGETALLFDPFNTHQLYQCINTLIQDEKLRKSLAKKGRKHSKIFTWAKYYYRMIKILRRISKK